MILGSKQAVLDRKLAHSDLQDLEVRYFVHHRRRFMLVTIVAMAMVVMAIVRALLVWLCLYPLLMASAF